MASKAWTSGNEAFMQGRPIEDNPYDEKTKKGQKNRRAWEYGWLWAQADEWVEDVWDMTD